MAVLQIKGDSIPNEYKWVYDWFGMDSTSPGDAEQVISAM